MGFFDRFRRQAESTDAAFSVSSQRPDLSADREPREIVELLIRALYEWEVETYRNQEKDPGSEVAQQRYAALIRLWCGDLVLPQPITFSNDPMHNPENESVVSVTRDGHHATVKTRQVGAYGFVSDFEYYLQQHDGRWFVTSVLYVDDEEKSECL